MIEEIEQKQKDLFKQAFPELYSHIKWSQDYGSIFNDTFNMSFNLGKRPYASIFLKANPITNGNRSEQIKIFSCSGDINKIITRMEVFINSITSIFSKINTKYE